MRLVDYFPERRRKQCNFGDFGLHFELCNGRVSDKPRRLPRHQREQAHNSTHTVVSSVLCTGYVVNKTGSCVLMNMILVIII
jgi:hypothetical protein